MYINCKYLKFSALLIIATVSISNAIAQTKRLSMDEVFQLADEQSLSLAASRSEIEEAEEGVSSAKSNRTPDIDFNLQLSYLGDVRIMDRDFSNGFNTSTPHFGNTFSVAVTQVLFAGGAIKKSIELSELKTTIAKLRYEGNRQAVRLLVAGYYLDLCQLRNQILILQKNKEQTQKLVDDIEANYEAGTALKSDITRYEMQLQDLDLRLTQAHNAFDITNSNLVAALDLPHSTVIEPDTNIVNLQESVANESEWLQKVDVSPAVRISESIVDINTKSEEIAKAAYRPTIVLRAEDNLNGPITFEIPTIDKNVNYWYVGVGVSYNLGAIYKQKHAVSKLHTATATARTQYEALQNDMRAKVHAAYVKYQEALSIRRTREKSLQLAHENYDVIQYRYLNGMALVTDMLDASNQQLSAELMLINSQMSIVYSHCMLLAAVGLL